MGLKRVIVYVARRSSGREGFLRPKNGSQKDPKWVFTGSLGGLSLSRASRLIRVRRSARKRQRPAFDGAPPAKANGDRNRINETGGRKPCGRGGGRCAHRRSHPLPSCRCLACGADTRIPAGIRLCCAVPPAFQCSLSIWLLRYGETNAKSALSVDVRV